MERIFYILGIETKTRWADKFATTAIGASFAQFFPKIIQAFAFKFFIYCLPEFYAGVIPEILTHPGLYLPPVAKKKFGLQVML